MQQQQQNLKPRKIKGNMVNFHFSEKNKINSTKKLKQRTHFIQTNNYIKTQKSEQ